MTKINIGGPAFPFAATDRSNMQLQTQGMTLRDYAAIDAPVSATDVAVMMGLLKIARIKTSPAHADNWVDLAGYAACGGELAAGKKGGTE
jgi:hypothetical protein